MLSSQRMAFTVMLSAGLLACTPDDGGEPVEPTLFTVTVVHLAPEYSFFQSGAFDTPVDAASPGQLGPGQRYSVEFHAAPGMAVSFASMFVPSNDLFFAPSGQGIALFDDQGQPRSGDVTMEVQLWDAGSELDQELGLGDAQPSNQTAPNTGDADADPNVRPASESYPNLPAVSQLILVTLASAPGNAFTLTIENVSTDQTLMLGNGTSSAVPLAPGVFVVHGAPDPLFAAGQPLVWPELEALVEDGEPGTLAATLASNTGLLAPLAPGVWWVHDEGEHLFEVDMPQLGNGMEALAEDGDPAELQAGLGPEANFGTFGGVYGEDVMPLVPGGAFVFDLEARPGDRLSIASMFAQSNDLFLAFDPDGVALFVDGAPISTNLATQLHLWDLGSEINEYPGAGPNQAPRQSAHDVGPDEDGVVHLVDDGFAYPSIEQLVQVTIEPQ